MLKLIIKIIRIWNYLSAFWLSTLAYSYIFGTQNTASILRYFISLVNCGTYYCKFPILLKDEGLCKCHIKWVYIFHNFNRYLIVSVCVRIHIHISCNSTMFKDELHHFFISGLSHFSCNSTMFKDELHR